MQLEHLFEFAGSGESFIRLGELLSVQRKRVVQVGWIRTWLERHHLLERRFSGWVVSVSERQCTRIKVRGNEARIERSSLFELSHRERSLVCFDVDLPPGVVHPRILLV